MICTTRREAARQVEGWGQGCGGVEVEEEEEKQSCRTGMRRYHRGMRGSQNLFQIFHFLVQALAPVLLLYVAQALAPGARASWVAPHACVRGLTCARVYVDCARCGSTKVVAGSVPSEHEAKALRSPAPWPVSFHEPASVYVGRALHSVAGPHARSIISVESPRQLASRSLP